MACCSEIQNECNKLVTIDYLKSFIKSGSTYLIQDSSGNGVDVNLNALAAANRRDDYCPTYGELTGGSLIPNWSQGSSPNGDQDGIVINSTCTSQSAAYANNQEVIQRDLSVRWTRFSSFSISVSESNISECGGSSDVCYSHSYTRYSKQMNNSCEITSGSTAATDTTDSEVTLTTSNFGTFGNWNNHCKTLTIPKNGSISSTTRTTNVRGSVSFRNGGAGSVLPITQSALTGSYSVAYSSYNSTTAVTAAANTVTSFDCAGGSFSASGTRYYDVHTLYQWKDSCGVVYPVSTVTPQDRITSTGSSSMGTKNGSFTALNPCDYTNVKTVSSGLTFSENGYSATVNFTQNCTGQKNNPNYGTGQWVATTKDFISFDISTNPSSTAITDCNAGSITYYGILKYTQNYKWRNGCGTDFPSTTSAVTVTNYVRNGSNDYVLNYEAVEPDCEADLYAEKTATVTTTFEGSTKTASKTFGITCPADPNQEKCQTGDCILVNNGQIVTGNISLNNDGGTINLQSFGCDGSCMYYSTNNNIGYKFYHFVLIKEPTSPYYYDSNYVKLYDNRGVEVTYPSVSILADRDDGVVIRIQSNEWRQQWNGEYRLHYNDTVNNIECDVNFTIKITYCDLLQGRGGIRDTLPIEVYFPENYDRDDIQFHFQSYDVGEDILSVNAYTTDNWCNVINTIYYGMFITVNIEVINNPRPNDRTTNLMLEFRDRYSPDTPKSCLAAIITQNGNND